MDERYTEGEIRRYEAIYGRHFISPGGEAAASHFLSHVPLTNSSTVLDVGCGVGGSAFYMARSFGCQVDGIDLAKETIRIARTSAANLGLQDLASFYEGDCVSYVYPRSNYALTYSRDTFLHIADKPRLLAKLHGCLASDGTLLFTDYIRGTGKASSEFDAYVEQHGYALETLASYQALLANAGFEISRSEDLASQFIDIHRAELDRLPTTALSAADLHYLTDRWQKKIKRVERGEQSWAFFIAQPL